MGNSLIRLKKGTDSVTLSVTNVEKDLGVLVDSQLSFKDHVSQTVLKANRVLGVIRRTFMYLNTDTMPFLFKGLVRPILEYGQVAWSPYRLGEQRMLESVQRRATKIIPGLRNLTYQERLTKLKLPTLVHRRKRGDMIDVYKYVNGLYTVQEMPFKMSTEDRTRGHSRKT